MLLPETLKLHNKNDFEFYYLYFLPWKNQMVESIQSNGGIVTCMAAHNNFQLMLKADEVKQYVDELKIDLIHAHLPWAGILARRVGKHTGVPVIYTEHNKQERYHFLTRWMNLATLNDLKEIIAVSKDVEGSIYKHKPKVKACIRTIVNGVNTTHFNRDGFFNGTTIRQKFDIPAASPIIGTVAVFRFQKRLDLWMEIARKILDRHPTVHFIIVGDGPLKSDLLKKLHALELEQRVHMPGLETDVRPYLAAIDIYMMCSIFEGLPVALLEAMAMRCSIISTDAGGIKEVIQDKVDGLLCPVDEPNKLVEYASYLLEDQSIGLCYGEQARLKVLESFSMEKMVNELEALYFKTFNEKSVD